MATLAAGEFDAILSDIYMPDGGGLDLVRELRAAKEWSQAELADKLDVSRQTINAIETWALRYRAVSERAM